MTAIKNQSLFLCHVLSFRDNSTSLSKNGFPGSNFPNFGFAPQTQILNYIFFNLTQYVTAIKNQSRLLCHVLSFWENSNSLSTNGLLLSNFKNLFFTVKHFFSRKSLFCKFLTVLLVIRRKKKKKFVTRDVTSFS